MEDKSDLTNNTIIDPTEKQEKKIENKSPEPKKIEKIEDAKTEKKTETKTKPQEHPTSSSIQPIPWMTSCYANYLYTTEPQPNMTPIPPHTMTPQLS